MNAPSPLAVMYSVCVARVAAWRWRSSRREAAAAADEAIRRARGAVDREGNVIQPRSFRGPRKPH